jgi:hypothetical protein
MTRLVATSRDEQIAVLHRAAEMRPVLGEVFTALAVAPESMIEMPLDPGESWRWSQTQRAVVGLAGLVLDGKL